MHFSTKCTIAVIMSSFGTVISIQDGHVNTCSVQQISNGPIERHGPSDLARMYRKYNIDLPRDVEAVVNTKNNNNNNNNSNGDNVVTIASNDMKYLTPVKIGGQTLNLELDTGSSDLWVFSPHLSRAEQRGHKIYDPSLSNTSKTLAGETWSISYDDGSQGASGDVCTDTVAVGTSVVQNQAVQLAAKLSSVFLNYTPFDGILGLGFKSINTIQPDQRNTFFDNVKGNLASPLFTATLKHQAPGSFDLDYVDAAKHTDPISYTEVDSSYDFWNITMESYTIGSDSAKRYCLREIVNTESPLILVDDSVVTAYYSEVAGATYDDTQGGYTFACNVFLPDITFSISDYNAVVAGKLLNLGPTDITGISCFDELQSSDAFDKNIFGDPLLKSQFVVFDTIGPRIGFAPQT